MIICVNRLFKTTSPVNTTSLTLETYYALAMHKLFYHNTIFLLAIPFITDKNTNVTLAYASVTSAMASVTSAMTGVTSAMTGVTSAMTSVTSAMTGVTSAMTGVTSAMTGVTSAMTGVTSAMTGVTSAMASVTSALASVTIVFLSNIVAQTSINLRIGFVIKAATNTHKAFANKHLRHNNTTYVLYIETLSLYYESVVLASSSSFKQLQLSDLSTTSNIFN